MEALRQENSRLRRKIEGDPTQKGKGKESWEAPRSLAYQPSGEESEYNPIPNTFTTIQQTPIISTHHTNIRHPATISRHPTPTNPTVPPYPPPISPLITSLLLFLPSSAIPSPRTRYHHNHTDIATLSLTTSPTYGRNRLRQTSQNIHHPFSPLYIRRCHFL